MSVGEVEGVISSGRLHGDRITVLSVEERQRGCSVQSTVYDALEAAEGLRPEGAFGKERSKTN